MHASGRADELARPTDAPRRRWTTSRNARTGSRSRSTATSRARTSGRRQSVVGGFDARNDDAVVGRGREDGGSGRVRGPASRREPVGVLSRRSPTRRCSTCGPCSPDQLPTSPARSSTPSRVTTSTRTDPAPAALRVIATAGHVDHGKSSLIVRLTRIDPDRWAEEKRRGLTIDLGYAWCTLPSGREVGFVDVPGHERFIGNMLAGVGPGPAQCCSWSRPTRVEAAVRGAPADPRRARASRAA